MVELKQSLARRGWSSGVSMNLVDLHAQQMSNLEIWEDEHAVFDVVTNFSHVNMYKQQGFEGVLDGVEPSSVHRQRRLDEMSVPHTARDISIRLGDTEDTQLPIYRNGTLTTLVLDGISGELYIWENSNPKDTKPARVWNLTSFFQS